MPEVLQPGHSKCFATSLVPNDGGMDADLIGCQHSEDVATARTCASGSARPVPCATGRSGANLRQPRTHAGKRGPIVSCPHLCCLIRFSSQKSPRPKQLFATPCDKTNDLRLAAIGHFIPPASVGTLLVMNSGVSQACTGCPRLKPSVTQKGLLDAVATTGEQSAESGYLAGDATPVQTRKRRLDATPEVDDPFPAKRARSTRTDIAQPGVEDRNVEQAAKV